MNFTLNILNQLGAAFNTSQTTIASQAISISDIIADSFTGLNLQPNNEYQIVFPASATTNPLSTAVVSFPEDNTLDFILNAGDLVSGITVTINTTTAITNFTIGILSEIGDSYAETLQVRGEDLTVIIDGVTTIGSNSVTQAIADDSTFDIEVISGGYHTYTNTVRIYDYNVEVAIRLIPIVTDPLDPNYRRAYPFFFYLIEPCSYNIHTYNAQSAPYGVISYYHSQDVATTYATAPNAVLDTCVPDIVSITQRIVVRAVANCGGTSPVIWDEIYTINGIETTEYKPYVVLERALNCCEILEQEIAINPQEIELYNTGIHECDITTVDPALVYEIITPEGETVALQSYSGTQVSTEDLVDLGFTYTPTSLGTYTLIVRVSNCCTTVEERYTFDVCNSWVVTNENCNIIKVINLSAINPITFTLRELSDYNTFDVVEINNTLQQNIEVLPLTEVEIDLQTDNLYTIEVNDNIPSTFSREQIFVLDCNIKKCKKELLRTFLCGENECAVQERVAARERLLEFSVLEKIIYQKWDEWKQQQTIDNTFSINDKMEDVITLSKAIETINKLCSKCGITNECSRNKRYTCNYTISNGGFYLVPIRSARIVVSNNGTDCGCN